MMRTSKTHPLQINGVAAPGGGTIGMTFCPGKKQTGALSGDWDRDLDTDLSAIEEWGATALVSLMEDHEYTRYGVGDLGRHVPHRIEHLKLPIVDGGTPDASWEAAWAREGRGLRQRLRAGERIVVHCRGGLGRTGLVAARLLVELGVAPDEAIAAVRTARPGAIETQAQERHVRDQRSVVE